MKAGEKLDSFGQGIVLITGASSGIGKEFARQLARQGHDLFLVARRRTQLQAISEQLQEEYGVQVHWLVADLATAAGVSDACEVIKANNITALINNAGIGRLGAFHEQSLDDAQDQLSLNVNAMVTLSHFAALKFLQKRSGLIVNLSSVAGFYPVPNFSIYALTKQFAKDFSLCLNHELEEHNVRCVAVCPGFTKTEFFQAAGMKKETLAERFAMNVEDCVCVSLAEIEDKESLIVTGIQNKLLAFFSRFLPNSLKLFVGNIIVRKGMH